MSQALALTLGIAGFLVVAALLLAQSTADTAEREHDDRPQP